MVTKLVTEPYYCLPNKVQFCDYSLLVGVHLVKTKVWQKRNHVVDGSPQANGRKHQPCIHKVQIQVILLGLIFEMQHVFYITSFEKKSRLYSNGVEYYYIVVSRWAW